MNDTCREMLQQAYLILDGEDVSEAQRRHIEEHLEACAPCYERYGLEQEVKTLLARLRGCTTCPDKLRIRITTLLEIEN